MPIDVDAFDEQDELAIDPDRWGALAAAVLSARGLTGDVELALRFVDEATIAALHEEFMGLAGPTDVLSFPIEDPGLAAPEAGGVPLLLGDIVVCPAIAARNAVEHRAAFDDELALLVVHGVLHLLGMDHEVPEEAEAMEALERALLAELGPGASGGRT
jgi:probable rRNA maturation factor